MKTFLIKLLVFCGLFFFILPGQAQNILTDGPFSSTTSIQPIGAPPLPLNTWCSWHDEGTVTSFNPLVTSGVCSFSFLNSSSNAWDVQLIQYGFPLIAGRHYRLTFDVKADANRSFGVYAGEESGLWTNLNAANYLQQATTGWQTKTIEFDATAVFSLHKLSFDLGASNIKIYFDNIILENTGPGVLNAIEIIGSAIPPDYWVTGVNMPTSDGITYQLLNYTLPAGEVKFRQNQNWSVNWGNNTFPTGTAYQDGPNIPVQPGTYNISFNRLTGAYNFVCINCTNRIGIIGSAVPPYNWSTDVKMTTLDGILYTLQDYILASGELRFRQNDDWSTNWGGNGFPSGTGTINAPNIQVPGGSYNITFNRLTGFYTFESHQPAIGILGSALSGWVDDIDLQTTDGVNYTLYNYPFTSGEVKFRQDNSWAVNWGNTSFPYGTAVSGGPNIPVTYAGNYNVYFNRQYSYYSFEIICPDPVLQCRADIILPASKDSCGATVWFNLPEITNPCGQSYVYQVTGLPSGSFFPTGTTTNTFIAINAAYKTAFCSFNVTVNDMQAPAITEVSADPSSLWPVNHKMKNVLIRYNTSDNCGAVTSKLTVSCNEPVNGNGDGNTSTDWIVVDNHHLQLRAERAGNGNGRIYTVTISSTDAAGNTAVKTIDVIVPHDMSTTVPGTTTISDNAVEDNNGMLRAAVTPNPAVQNFNLLVQSGSSERIEVRLFDISGKLITTMFAQRNGTLRFGNELKPGVYFIQILQGQQHKTIKVVKQ